LDQHVARAAEASVELEKGEHHLGGGALVQDAQVFEHPTAAATTARRKRVHDHAAADRRLGCLGTQDEVIASKRHHRSAEAELTVRPVSRGQSVPAVEHDDGCDRLCGSNVQPSSPVASQRPPPPRPHLDERVETRGRSGQALVADRMATTHVGPLDAR
jgi:hypothetical protein